MEDNFLYQLFNNSTIAVVLGVVIGVMIAIWQYKKQKKIDFLEFRKKEIIDLFILLNEKAQYVNFILDRNVNTYKFFVEGKDKDKMEFFKSFAGYEIPRLSQTLNEHLPLIEKKITLLVSLYFTNNKEIKELYDSFKIKLKKWHDFMVQMSFIEKLDFKKKTSEIPELDLTKIEENIKDLIEKVAKI